jgi:hypothetical protein
MLGGTAAAERRSIATLSLNAAARYTHYDISGVGGWQPAPASNSFDPTTWKVGVVWGPRTPMRLCFTRVEDFRALTFPRCSASASTFGSLPIPSAPRAVRPSSVQLTGGNPVRP